MSVYLCVLLLICTYLVLKARLVRTGEMDISYLEVPLYSR